jgi:hypothetical protein
MSDRIEFPSVRYPAVPAVSLALPPTWEGAHTPGTLLSARRVTPPGEFIANVVVRWQRVEAELDLPQAAKLVDDGVAGLTEVEDIGRWLVTSGELRGYAREFSFRDAAAGVLAQAWRVFRIPQGEVADLFEVVGTVGAGQTEEFLQVRTILDSVQIAAGAPVERQRA